MRSKWPVVLAALLAVVAVALVNSRRAAGHRAAERGVRPVVTAVESPDASFTPPPALDTLDCDSWPGRGTTTEARQGFAVGSHHDLSVRSVRCFDGGPTRGPSVVRVVDIADDHRIVATLIRPSQDLHVLAVSADAHGVTVTASEAGPVPSGDQRAASDLGSVFAWRFATADGLTYSTGSVQRVAFACSPADLRYELVGASGTQAAADFAVRLTNRTSRPCAVEGYPQIVGSDVEGDRVTPTLRPGSPGIGTDGLPGVLVLKPGASAVSDLIAAAKPTAGVACGRLDALTLALPTGELLGTEAVHLHLCGLTVRPLRAG